MTIEAVDLPSFQPIAVDTDAAVRNALEKRTDLLRQTKSLEVNDIEIRYLRNQTLPDVTAQLRLRPERPRRHCNLVRGPGPFGPGSGAVIDQVGRSFGAVLGDLFANRYPQWTASLNVSYPIGASQQEANLARARIEYSQAQTQLKSQQLQVSTQVREAARQVQTNQKRVETHARRALVRRAPARGRAAQVRRRHLHELHRLPGAARPGAGAQQRAQGDPRLRPVGRRPRDRAGSAADGGGGATTAGALARPLAAAAV